MQTKIIICIIAILLIIIFLYKENNKEHAAFLLDGLYIPDNPLGINESNARHFIRTIGIKRHLKIDRFGRIENIWYKPPKPELGEKECHIVPCSPSVKDDICWICH